MNNKILCISLRTPPEVRPQAILIGKMIPEWIKQGLEPVIFTYKKENKWDINIPIYETDYFQVNKYLNKLPLTNNFFKKKYYLKKIIEIEKIIKEHNIKLVFSFSNPQESNILGAMLKEKLGIKFVSHFSDPWYDNPFNPFNPFNPLSFFNARQILEQEKFVIENSDGIIFTNEVAKNLIMKKYQDSWNKKSYVIPHCYDSGDYLQIKNKKENSNKFILSYIGAFYKQRNPEILFKALSNLLKKNPEYENKIKFNLVGVASNYTDFSEKDVNELIDEYKLKNIIKIIPPVSFKESLEYMKLSDCLIVLDANIPNSPFLPSKLIDYAGTENIVLGVTRYDSPTANFLNNLGYKFFNYQQQTELEDYLIDLITKKINLKVNMDFLKKYDVKSTTFNLIEIFNKILC